MDFADDTGLELKEGDIAADAGFVAMLGMVQDHWLGSFLLNVLGYVLIILPAALLIRRWKKDPQVKRGKLAGLFH